MIRTSSAEPSAGQADVMKANMITKEKNTRDFANLVQNVNSTMESRPAAARYAKFQVTNIVLLVFGSGAQVLYFIWSQFMAD